MSEASSPQEIQELAKATTDGICALVDSEVLPLEEKYRSILSDERKLFRDDGRLVDEIAEARLSVRKKSAEAGFYTMLVPEEIGGSGFPALVVTQVLEGLYRRYGPGRLLIGWSNAFLTSPLIASFVDGPSHMFMSAGETIRKEVLPSLIAGETTVCFALTEPDAGSDMWGLKCKARRDGDDWILNGTKQWITNAPYADHAAIFAVTNPELVEQHRGGISAFLVDASSPGYNRDNILPIMGHVSSDCGAITLDDVRVSNDRMMGPLDQGFQIGMMGISEGRLSIAAGCIGMAEWALDRCLEYAKERKTFGVPIAEHQAIQFMMADSAIDIFTGKQTFLRTAQLVDEIATTGRMPVKEISIAKAYCVEGAERVLDRAIQIHGGMGLSNEMPFHEGARVARTLRIPDGTAEIQRRTIARQLLRGETVF
jgi:acyl-CoA dehydrogenase